MTSNNRVLAFNPEKETYTTFPLPTYSESSFSKNDQDYYYSRDKTQLVKFKGHLSLISEAPASAGGHLELWVMEDYGNYKWKKIKELGIEALKEKEPIVFLLQLLYIILILHS